MRHAPVCLLWFALLTGMAVAARPMKWDDLMVLKSAADKGDREAQYLLGLQYQAGDGTARNPAEAARWFRQAAEAGHAEAAAALRELQVAVEAGQVEAAQEEERLRTEAAQGNEAAKARLGALLAKGGNRGPDPAILALTPAPPPVPDHAVDGAPTTQTSAGARPLAAGRPAGEDPDETVRWSLILSGLRGSEAYLVRGYLLENGIAMNRDLEMAAVYYRRAAEAGLPHAQYHLGLLLAEGRGVRRDLVEACAWFALAAEAGSAGARAALSQREKELGAAERGRLAALARTLVPPVPRK